MLKVTESACPCGEKFTGEYNLDQLVEHQKHCKTYTDLVGLVQATTRAFDTGATRDTDSEKLDYEGFISPIVDHRFAQYMHKCRLRNIPAGQTVRASDNWQKGMPLDAYAKSLVRHVAEFRLIHDGYKAFDEKGNELELEEVLCAIRFNVDGYLYEILNGKLNKVNKGRIRTTLPEVPQGQSVNTTI